MGYIIDLQGFYGVGKEFIVKELAITSLDGGIFHHFLFKPPYDIHQLSTKLQAQVNWLKNSHHGFAWEHGFTEYSSLGAILQDVTAETKDIFVKGEEKKKILQRFLERDDVLDLASFGCPSLRELQDVKHATSKCCIPLSHAHMVCAVENVVNLRKWYNTSCSDECGLHRDPSSTPVPRRGPLWRLCC